MKLKKIFIFFLLLILLKSNTTLALKLGKINLLSSINQPLDAIIELIDTQHLKQNEIIVTIANNQEFKQYDIVSSPILSNIIINKEKNGKKNFIRIKSINPIKQPNINLLIAVFWPDGKILRKLFLSFNQIENFIPNTENENSYKDNQSGIFDTFYPSNEDIFHPSNENSEESNKHASNTSKNVTVNSNDMLWNIAKKNNPSNQLSIKQVMLAIQRENPNSFFYENINTLKKGSILRIPNIKEIESLTKQEASFIVDQQNKAWKKKQEQVNISRRLLKSPLVNNVKSSDHLSIMNSTSMENQNTNHQSDNNKVTHQPKGPKIKKITDKNNENNKINLLNEQLDKHNREQNELNDSIGELHKQIDTLKELISLKDEQLLKLQGIIKQELTSQNLNSDQGNNNYESKNINQNYTIIIASLAFLIVILVGVITWIVKKSKSKTLNN